MILYHGTKKQALKSIINNGFKTTKETGRFGAGVYFALDVDYAKQFSQDNTVLSVDVDVSNILNINYSSIKNIYPNLSISWDEYEGVPELKDYALGNGYNGIQVNYDDDVSEIIIFDVALISNLIRVL